MSASQLEALGFSPREARRLARRRLGARARHRRAALRETGGDARGLIALLPLASTKRSPILPAASIALAIALALALNPRRAQVLESMCALLPLAGPLKGQRWIPLTPEGVAPMGIAAMTLWTLAAIGAARLATAFAPRKQWRLCLYALILLGGLAIIGGICWISGLQILLSRSWGFDIAQGGALGAFVLAYWWAAYFAMKFWWRDLERRCPSCIRLPGMPESRGKELQLIVDPLEVESICLHGHGLAVESRWRRTFESGGSL